MRRIVSQGLIVLRVSLKGLPRRWWPSLNAVIGTASVVGVLVVLLSIAAGYSQALRMSGSADNAIVMRAGARSEIESSLSGEQARLICNAEGVRRDAQDEPLAAAEVYAIASIENADGDPMNVAVRGVEPASYVLRSHWRLARGRKPEPGTREVVVGARAQQHFDAMRLGARLKIADGDWTIVGVFEADGGVVESEIWADAATLQSAYQRGDTVQVVYARLRAGLDAPTFGEALARDPRLNISAQTEAEYYREQSAQMSRFVSTLGYSIALLMGLAAVFAALNAGYASTASRTKEIATMIALGADHRAIRASVLLEAVALALLGGLLGSGLAWLLFDGRVASTLFFSRDFTQVVFAFDVGGDTLPQAVLGAVLIGALGGLWPALRATRLPVAQALAVRR